MSVRTLTRRIGKAAIWLAAIVMSLAVGAWWAARPAAPDAFYDAPARFPVEAGALIRAEPFARTVPEGAHAWRILYTTTRADGAPAVASAIVVAAGETAAPRPVLAWAHGTTGIAPGCAPSLMRKPFANVPGLALALKEGWAYVATDYVGLGTSGGHAYLAGEEAARGVLDSVRAARQLAELKLDSRVVVWGHSQGGHSALWAGMRAKDYAPELSVIGVGAFAPATDLKGLVQAGQTTMFGKIVLSYLAHAYGAIYPDIAPDVLLKPGTRWLTRDIAGRCVGEIETLASVAQTFLLPGDGAFTSDPAAGPLGARLDQNMPRGPFAMPVLLAQGEADDLVVPALQKAFVEGLCKTGQPVRYRTYGGRDHISLVAEDSPLAAEAIGWTRDRFAEKPATADCGR
jgi:pimeloyl-ACP methyl ester carboxylesterase